MVAGVRLSATKEVVAGLESARLSIVAASSDGREPPTALLFPILAATQCEDVQDLIAWAAGADARAFASLVPVVFAAAAAGDPRANALAHSRRRGARAPRPRAVASAIYR